MTKQEQIEILERAIPLIDTVSIGKLNGVCGAMCDVLNKWPLDFFDDVGVELPERNGSAYCWPLTREGDEARRQFLRDHIERLKKELTTP